MSQPVVEVVTNHGTFVIELNPTQAPKSVANFLAYVDARHYDGTVFR
jgi:cyclophilin family peptidyl-prolyl cis-trans isomerase